MSEVSRDFPRTRPVYRWTDLHPLIITIFDETSDALEAAAFATDRPLDLDTLHLVDRRTGVEVLARAYGAAFWLVPR